MSKDVLTYLALAVPALVAGFFGMRKSSSDDRMVSATEVEKLGERLDKQAERLDAQDKRIETTERHWRRWREYAYDLLRILADHDIEAPEPPKDELLP